MVGLTKKKSSERLKDGDAGESAKFSQRDSDTASVWVNSIPNLRSAFVLGHDAEGLAEALRARGVEATHGTIQASGGSYTFTAALDPFKDYGDSAVVDAVRRMCDSSEWTMIAVPTKEDGARSKVWWIEQFMAAGHEPVDVRDYVVGEDKGQHVQAYFRRADRNAAVKFIPTPTVKEGGKGFKVLWWSNSPTAMTGYGAGTKHVVYPLNRHYDVACLAYYGLEGSAITMNGLKIFPKMYDQFGIDAADMICRNWKPDIMVTLFDIWIGDSPLYNGQRDWFTKIHPRWVAYFPVDHYPIPVPILNQARLAYHAVAMSRFGLNELRRNGVEASYIPHGVDTKTFTPVDDRSVSRKWLLDVAGVPLISDADNLPWDHNSFIIGKVAANKDTTRKSFDREMVAFKLFLEQNPDAKKDARLYWHTDPRFPGGFHLDHYAHLLGLDKYIRRTHPFYIYGGVSEQNMAKMYQSFDVFTSVSRNEGFGIPIVETQACGVPAIVNNCTSMPELVDGHGWVLEPKTWEPTALLSNQFIPDEERIAEAYGEAYGDPDKVRRLGLASRDFAERYDWENVVVPMWMQLIERIRENLREKTYEERRVRFDG